MLDRIRDLTWNVFSKRVWKLRYQKLTRGWDDSQTWNLFIEIAKFSLPRLKRFRELNNGHPSTLTEKRWNTILDQIIEAFEIILQDDICRSPQLTKKVNRGLSLFSEHFEHLWW